MCFLVAARISAYSSCVLRRYLDACVFSLPLVSCVLGVAYRSTYICFVVATIDVFRFVLVVSARVIRKLISGA